MSDRVEQIRQVVEETRRRRSGGEPISDDNITSANPDLMPELKDELKKLALIEAARNEADRTTASILANPGENADTAASDSDSMHLVPGIEVPDFELLAPVGRGGFGEVWVARHRLHGEFCAVKLVARHQDIELDGIRVYRQRAKDHPGLVPIEHVGETDQCIYYVMPLADDVKGSTTIRGPGEYEPKTLQWCLNNLSPPPIDEVISLGIDLVDSIAILHRAGLAHQDIKPPNIMMFGGRWKLGDLGLLAPNDQLAGNRGTIAFWPPEGTSSPIADLYALGKTLYLLATGQPLDRFDQFLDHGFEIPGDPQLVERFVNVLSRACHDDVAERFRSAEEMRAALQGPASVSAESPPKRLQPTAVVEPGPGHARNNAAIVGLIIMIVVATAFGILFMAGEWFFGPHDMARFGGRMVGDHRDGHREDGSSAERMMPGFEVSGCLAIACNRPARGPNGRAQALMTLPSPVFVGDQLRVQVKHSSPTRTFVLRLRSDGRVELLHPQAGPDVMLAPTEQVSFDIEVKPGDVGSRPGQLSGFVVIESERVPFAEWLDNLNLSHDTPGTSLVWKSPVSVVGWKYNSTRGEMLNLLAEDAAPGPGNPRVEIDEHSRTAGEDLRNFCEYVKTAPHTTNVWAIVFPCLNPGS